MVPSAVVIMGVAGSGKSTVGQALADRLGWTFLDGDDFHPTANVAKMRRGEPLDDIDRKPWLDRLNAMLRSQDAIVLAASALKRAYRDQLREGLPADEVRFVHLDVDPEILARRLRDRRGHYMPPSLLASQLATLEPPTSDEASTVDASRPVDQVVHDIVRLVA